MKDKNVIIDEYLAAVEKAIVNGGETRFWPAAQSQINSYFIDILSESIFDKFKKNPKRCETALLNLPVTVLRWFLCPFVILGLKLACRYDNYPVAKEEMVSFLLIIYEVLRKKVVSHPFCLDRANRIFTREELTNFLLNKKWVECQHQSERGTVNYLSLDLESYVWSINFDIFAYAVFWHGPYHLSDGNTLLVKKFFDLDSEVWQSKVNYSHIDLLFVFNGGIKVEIDFMSHLFYKDLLWEKLKKYAVLVDGKCVIKLREIEKINEHFSKKRREQVLLIEALSPQEIIHRGIEIYYFMFREFFQFYNEDWRPPEKIYQKIEESGLKYWRQFSPKKEGRPPIEFFRRLYDPRNDFTG